MRQRLCRGYGRPAIIRKNVMIYGSLRDKNNAAWYLLQSKPHQERRALENLRNQGFECFLPLYLRERLRR